MKTERQVGCEYVTTASMRAGRPSIGFLAGQSLDSLGGEEDGKRGLSRGLSCQLEGLEQSENRDQPGRDTCHG
jgi:hypothetical protein